MTANPLLGLLADCWFAMRRRYYRIRFRRLRIGPGVRITGRIQLIGTTTLTLGAHSVVRQSLRVDGGGQVSVGAHTRVNGDCWIGARRLVAIGDWCLISDCCIFDSDYHNSAPRERHLPPRQEATKPVRIGPNVWIGTRALVTKGSVIGADSVVGAGAVVRGAVPAGVVAIGNPATVVKTFSDAERWASSAAAPSIRNGPRPATAGRAR